MDLPHLWVEFVPPHIAQNIQSGSQLVVRFVSVNLTTDGKRFIERIFPGHSQAISESLGGLTASEQQELARLCAKLGQHAEALSHGRDEEDAS